MTAPASASAPSGSDSRSAVIVTSGGYRATATAASSPARLPAIMAASANAAMIVAAPASAWAQ